MPIYEYCCEECGHIFEEWQSGFDEKQLPCPICGGDSKRLISHTSFVLKGSGWYATDYANKHSSPPSGNSNEENTKGAAKEAVKETDASSKSITTAKSDESKSASPAST